jgi:hypothetical protein
MNYKNQNLNNLSIDEIINLRKIRRLKILARKKQNKAARIIQKAVKAFLERKRFNIYIKKFKQTQKRYNSALKIQIYYRHRLYMRKFMEKERKRRVFQMKKGEVMKGIFTYILKFQYRKIKMK